MHRHTLAQLVLWVCVKGRPVRCWSRMAGGHCSSSTSPDKDKAGGVREGQHTPCDGSPQLLICLSLPVAHLTERTMQPVYTHCVCTITVCMLMCVHTHKLLCVTTSSLIPLSVVPPECYDERLRFCSLSPQGSQSEQQFVIFLQVLGSDLFCVLLAWLDNFKCRSFHIPLIKWVKMCYSSVQLPLLHTLLQRQSVLDQTNQ